MDFIPAIKSGFKNCFQFTGRASRSEFWWFYLFFVLTIIGTFMLAGLFAAVVSSLSVDNDVAGFIAAAVIGLMFLACLVCFFPVLSLIFRRLHDSDKSAWFMLLYLIPLGGIVLLVFYCQPGTHGSNPHGPNPLRPGDSVAKTFE